MLRRLLLGSAFVLCALGIFNLLSGNDPAEPVVTAEPQVKQVPVWRARRELAKGERVTRSDLESSSLTLDLDAEPPVLSLKPGALARETIFAGMLVDDPLLVMPDAADYIDHLIKPGMIPYPLTIDNSSNYQSVLNPGDRVDVVIIASLEQNLANDTRLSDYRGFSVGPLLTKRRVLSVADSDRKGSTIILELSRDDVSRVMVARRIGQLDIHKSTGEPLQTVRTGDVLPGYSSVTELRGTKRQVN